MSDSLWPHGLQYTRLPCPSPTLGACSNSCPSSQWCHTAISSSVTLFLCPQSFPASGSFSKSQVFASGDQSIGVSASVLAMNIQGWFSLVLIDLISLLSKEISRVFSSTTVQNHQLFVLSLLYGPTLVPYMTTRKTIVLTLWTFVSRVMDFCFLIHYVGLS